MCHAAVKVNTGEQESDDSFQRTEAGIYKAAAGTEAIQQSGFRSVRLGCQSQGAPDHGKGWRFLESHFVPFSMVMSSKNSKRLCGIWKGE